MVVITRWEELADITNPITLVIGNFDGVHRGHQELIKKAKEITSKNDRVMLLTFDPHPVEFFSKKRFYRLTPSSELECLLMHYGVDYWFKLEFNRAIADLNTQQFLSKLAQFNNIKRIVVGFNFKFGKDKSGGVDSLRDYQGQYNYKLYVVDPVLVYDSKENISSTLIRGLLANGELDKANQSLGRAYTLLGSVVHGKKIGRKLGFPTANLQVEDNKTIPADGVYAGVVNERSLAAVSIGVNPSFKNRQRTIEVYILDHDGTDLYGKGIKLELVKFLRPQIKFASKEDLVTQITKDVSDIKALRKQIIR